MMTLTSGNYHGLDANKTYWSVSQFKQFDKCEACGLASARGQYHREETDALLIGGYVDAYFAGEMDEFVSKHADTMFKKNGELYAKFDQANQLINTIECQPLMMEFLEGEKQVIRTGELFGVDSWSDAGIVDVVVGGDITGGEVGILLNSKNNGENYYLSPIAMVWDDNHYYVIGHSEKHPEPFIINFRIDRICHAEITEEPSILPEEGFDVEEYVNRQFRMNVGEAVEVVLECKNERMRNVIDHFGEDVETWIADDDHFRVRVQVADSPTFYSWVFGFVGDIRIVEPAMVVKSYRKMLHKGLRLNI